jgi:hypothetical protein
MGIRPPGVADNWDETNVEAKAMLLAYGQIREYEDLEFQINLAGAKLNDKI